MCTGHHFLNAQSLLRADLLEGMLVELHQLNDLVGKAFTLNLLPGCHCLTQGHKCLDSTLCNSCLSALRKPSTEQGTCIARIALTIDLA